MDGLNGCWSGTKKKLYREAQPDGASLVTLRRRLGIREAVFVFDGGMKSRWNLEMLTGMELERPADPAAKLDWVRPPCALPWRSGAALRLGRCGYAAALDRGSHATSVLQCRSEPIGARSSSPRVRSVMLAPIPILPVTNADNENA
ncbi:hypothetical protein MAMT_02171 [Methylacidimicrobium tartarophylax]|uniref:Uncharacterized protein n=1 Tax=Methylacidimicrobium tartarophylax TaxID=1041768 RepID=A0A5E6MIW5_9BACT|nr:hypothetical protein MAMT_02171 [Methylacidimicrobium tartarophylax]